MNVKQIAASEVVVGDYLINIGIVNTIVANGPFLEMSTAIGPHWFPDLSPVFVLDKR